MVARTQRPGKLSGCRAARTAARMCGEGEVWTCGVAVVEVGLGVGRR